MIRTVQRITERVAEAVSLLGGLLMVALTSVVFASVVSRYFFNLPIRATSELAGLIFAWLVFITAIAVTHREDNIAVTYFRGLLPKPVQKAVELLTKIVMFGFAIAILLSSLEMSTALISRPLPSLRISSAWLNGSVAVGFVGLVLVLLVQILTSITGRSAERRDEEAPIDSPEGDPERIKGIE